MNFEELYKNKQPATRVLAMPTDTNPMGDVFGGWIMSQVDIAGSIVAHHKAKGRVVTVAVTDFLFKKPVFVGDLISCFGEIEKTGRTSITVKVTVCAERNRNPEELIKVTEATLVYVAVDDDGQPYEFPKD